jgi:hypothetical protein
MTGFPDIRDKRGTTQPLFYHKQLTSLRNYLPSFLADNLLNPFNLDRRIYNENFSSTLTENTAM